MRKYTTEILAIDPNDNRIKKWAGPYIEAISMDHAKHICQTKELGYCRVTGVLVAEVDYETGEKTDYDLPNLN